MLFEKQTNVQLILTTLQIMYASEDKDFLQNIHKAKTASIFQAAAYSAEQVSKDSHFYTVKENRRPAAFFCINTTNPLVNVLEGFHVSKKYRSKDFLSAYWILAKRLMGDKPTAIGLADKNQKAIHHLLMNGFIFDRSATVDGEPHTFLMFYP